VKLTTLIAVTVVANSSLLAGPPGFGFRHDGTGVFPADCTPVTTWNESDFKKVESGKDGRGRPILKEVFDKESRQNIVWKTPLPMYCNAGLTVAGGKVFALADPGGIGFAGRAKPDYLGVRLYCLDAKDGKQLWTEDLHHIDLVPAGDQEKLRTTLKEVRDFYFEVLAAHLQWQGSWHHGHGTVETNDTARAAYAKAAERYRQFMPQVPATLDELAQFKFGKPEYVQVKFEKMVNEYRKDIVEKKKLAAKYSYQYNDFFGQGSFIECAFATPASDGQRIYVTTHFADAYCYDLTGKLVWKQWYKYRPDRMITICSPMIYGDLLVFAGRTESEKGEGVWMAADKRAGNVVWRTPKEGTVNYAHVAPSYHQLLIGGDAAKPLEVLWCPSGQVLRLRDGKVLAKELGCHGNARPWAVQGDMLVIENGSGDGGPGKAKTFPEGTVAFRLKATDEDTVTGEQLWVKPKTEALARLVARNGIVYGYTRKSDLVAVQLLTGQTVGSVAGGLTPHHFPAIAGPYVFGLDLDGRCAVAGLDPQGKPVGPARISRLGTRAFGKYDSFNEGAQPSFSGNRAFIRSYTDVYCLGNPTAPMRLSKEHQ
jgi:outer membrane protein assembly factor BamB